MFRPWARIWQLRFRRPDVIAEDLTPAAVRAYRDALEHAVRSPAAVAKHLSALRGFADAIDAVATIKTVRPARVAHARALDHDEWTRLLRMPDRRTRQDRRDVALLHLLGSAGLRRGDAAELLVSDVDERRRSNHPAASGDRAVNQLVGNRPLRQEGAHPRHPARRGRPRRDHRVGQDATRRGNRAPAVLTATNRPIATATQYA